MVSQNRSFKSIIIIVPEEWPAKHKNKTNINVHKLPDKFLKKNKENTNDFKQVSSHIC